MRFTTIESGLFLLSYVFFVWWIKTFVKLFLNNISFWMIFVRTYCPIWTRWSSLLLHYVPCLLIYLNFASLFAFWLKFKFLWSVSLLADTSASSLLFRFPILHRHWYLRLLYSFRPNYTTFRLYGGFTLKFSGIFCFVSSRTFLFFRLEVFIAF